MYFSCSLSPTPKLEIPLHTLRMFSFVFIKQVKSICCITGCIKPTFPLNSKFQQPRARTFFYLFILPHPHTLPMVRFKPCSPAPASPVLELLSIYHHILLTKSVLFIKASLTQLSQDIVSPPYQWVQQLRIQPTTD